MFKNHEVEKVKRRFEGVLVRTPCQFSHFLSELTGAKVYLKLENMHRTGSFKERGALNFLLNHDEGCLSHVITASAGNHAQAVAFHASRLSIKATIFMPLNTPNTKVLETERFKATVKLTGQSYDEAYREARDFADTSGAHYLHAYNDLDVVQGQATIALEILEQIGMPDAVFVPVGGGGLIAGIAQYLANLASPNPPKIIGVEAYDFQSMAQALKKGEHQPTRDKKTIAEGIAVKSIGELTQEICTKLDPEMTFVTDHQIQAAIMLLLERQKVVTEGAGAASVAAFLGKEYRHKFRNKTVILIVSGGNIDISLLARLTAQELVTSSRLCRMSVVIKDTPGSLSKLLQLVTRASGNIIDIRHERSFADIKWNEVLVDLTVETKDEIHEKLMLMSLTDEGYSINTEKRELGRAT